jgi:hypothetical protein
MNERKISYLQLKLFECKAIGGGFQSTPCRRTDTYGHKSETRILTFVKVDSTDGTDIFDLFFLDLFRDLGNFCHLFRVFFRSHLNDAEEICFGVESS